MLHYCHDKIRGGSVGAVPGKDEEVDFKDNKPLDMGFYSFSDGGMTDVDSDLVTNFGTETYGPATLISSCISPVSSILPSLKGTAHRILSSSCRCRHGGMAFFVYWAFVMD